MIGIMKLVILAVFVAVLVAVTEENVITEDSPKLVKRDKVDIGSGGDGGAGGDGSGSDAGGAAGGDGGGGGKVKMNSLDIGKPQHSPQHDDVSDDDSKNARPKNVGKPGKAKMPMRPLLEVRPGSGPGGAGGPGGDGGDGGDGRK